MSITGSQQAYKQARAGLARSGTTRSDYFTTRHFIGLIGGTDRSANIEKGTFALRDVLNDQPDTCSMEVYGFTPTVGQALIMATGANDNRIFGGTIVSTESLPVTAAALERWRINATDYTWLFNRRRVSGRFAAQAADVLVRSLVATYASTFGVRHVQTGAPTIEVSAYSGALFADVMTDLCARASTSALKWSWYLDAYQDVHFFSSEPGATAPADITTSNLTYEQFYWRPTIDQVRTRVYVQGGGGRTAAVATGATTIPVDECGWYQAAGGQVIIDAQVITYTGRSASSGPGDLTGVSGVSFDILDGVGVNLWITVNDTAAQTALAALEGGDGIREGYLRNGSLGYASCVELGEQELALRANPDNLGRYVSRDRRTHSGKTIEVHLPARSITHQAITLQSVTRRYEAPGHWVFEVSFQRVQRDFNRFLNSAVSV
jgi:hypothetical protein